jgi:hypothetical protein
VEIMFTKEKKSPAGQTLAMIRGVDSFASFGFSIEKLAKKTWVDGQQ